jgi:hypothetical protein
MPCQHCEQARIAVHTAQVEMEHKDRVIADLKAKLAEAERKVKDAEKGKKK